MRQHLAREPALPALGEPTAGRGLPRPRPLLERNFDLDRPQPPQAALGERRPDGGQARGRGEREVDRGPMALPLDSRNRCARLPGIDRQWLLAEDRLAGVKGEVRLSHVSRRRGGDEDAVHARGAHQRLGARGELYAGIAKTLRLRVPGRHRMRAAVLRQARDHAAPLYAEAEDAQADAHRNLRCHTHAMGRPKTSACEMKPWMKARGVHEGPKGAAESGITTKFMKRYTSTPKVIPPTIQCARIQADPRTAAPYSAAAAIEMPKWLASPNAPAAMPPVKAARPSHPLAIVCSTQRGVRPLMPSQTKA